MKKYLLPISMCVLLLIGYLFFLKSSEVSSSSAEAIDVVKNGLTDAGVPGATVVALTKEGFVPKEFTIQAGDTVTFTSITGAPFWPASNLHPSHLLYPAFDPQVPIQPNQSWSFVFTKKGVWEFHDHLSPYFTGVITVTE